MRRLLAALVFSSLAACGGLGSDFGPPVEGRWTGTSVGQSFTLDLLQTGNVTGVATVTGGAGGTRTYAVSGTFSHPTLIATLEASVPSESIQLDATVSGRAMLGSLTGGGFSGDAIALTRQ